MKKRTKSPKNKSLTDKFACSLTLVKPARCDNDETTGNSTQEFDCTSHLYM